jgi:hypothetical protein
VAYDPLQVATVYAATFAARTDVYSIWVVGPDPEKPIGWRPVREPLTPEVVLAGLTGKGPSLSAYMIAPGSTSHVLAYDFDTDDGLSQAYTLSRFMVTQGLPSYVETSRRGAHLWCILDRALPAVAIRMAARGLLQGAGLPDTDDHIEIRPGSDRVDAEWHEHVEGAVVGSGLGHALRLPLMPHPKTGKQGRLLYPSGTPIPGTLADIILAMDWAPADKLLVWAERYKPPPVERIPPKHSKPHEPFPEDPSTASELLRTLWGVPNAAPGRSVRCPAHEDKMPSLSILRDDRRVICKAGHCVLNNNDHGRGTYELRKLAPTSTNG